MHFPTLFIYEGNSLSLKRQICKYIIKKLNIRKSIFHLYNIFIFLYYIIILFFIENYNKEYVLRIFNILLKH